MAKKNKAPEVNQRPFAAAATLPKNQSFQFNAGTIIPLLASFLYLSVHFISDWGGYDGLGSQWTFLVGLDIAVIFVMLARKNDYLVAAARVFNNLFSKLYLAFFILAGISIFAAINPTESVVCYVRIIATIVAYFNLTILLQGRVDLFKILAQVLALILFVESCQTISKFVEGYGNIQMNDLIMSLKGTTGNKNIFAAGLVIKIPFLLYCIHRFGLLGKIVNAAFLVFATWAIFIVNARASYLSFFITLVMYLIFCVITYIKEKKLDRGLFRIALVLIPAIIAFFISQLELAEASNIPDPTGEVKKYGSVTDRLASVSEVNDESNQVRFRLWAHAIDYTKKHPVMGCGIGNWKIASIPYQREITNDLYVPIHAHNDFLEMFGELGIAGGLLYLSIFICIIVFTYKTYYSDADEDTKLVSVFSFMAFVVYMVDAMFNFPMERPISQVFFILITATNVGSYIRGREEQKDQKVILQKAGNFKTLFAFVSILLLIPSFYVTYQTYKSLIIQKDVLGDLNNEPLRLDWKEITTKFPSIPNLSATAQPIESIKGRYLYEAGHYDEALVLLTKGQKANPAIAYSEFLKAGLFFRMNKLDSAFSNGMFAFYTRPKAKTYYQTLIAVLAKMKDTVNIRKAFEEYDKYRHNNSFGWDMYLLGMINAEINMARMPQRMVHLVDSGLKIFPGDTGLLKRKSEILSNILQFNRTGTAVVNQAQLNESVKLYTTAVDIFGQAAALAATNADKSNELYTKAANLFLQSASINAANIAALENAAICYFNMRQYPKAISLFNKEMAMISSANGKPEYFKAVALINTGKRDEACALMQVASKKGWKDADAILKSHCGITK